jgi:hypothetical protein
LSFFVLLTADSFFALCTQNFPGDEQMSTTFFDKIFRDKNGELVVAQMPNPPLILWIAASLLGLLFTSGKVSLGLNFLAFGSLFTWAWQELFDGVNYFRKALGFCVLVGVMASKILGTQLGTQ